LCSSPKGISELMNHSFFASIDWTNLEKKAIDPPFKPAVVSDEAFYFDTTFTSKTPKDSPGEKWLFKVRLHESRFLFRTAQLGSANLTK
jgi:hypothetical protein